MFTECIQEKVRLVQSEGVCVKLPVIVKWSYLFYIIQNVRERTITILIHSTYINIGYIKHNFLICYSYYSTLNIQSILKYVSQPSVLLCNNYDAVGI